MKKRMRIAVVGCGDIARFVTFACKINSGIEVACCVDRDAARAKKFGKWFLVPRHYADYDEMLGKERLDAVYLAVPHFLHLPMIRKAMEKGLHVFCEKPVATSVEEGLEVCSLAKRTGLKVGINYQYRYDKYCFAMAMAARKGELGEIFSGRCNTPWHREGGYFSNSPWHKSRKASGGGTLLTQGSHALDVLLWAAGKVPLKASGMKANARFKDVEVEDLCMGMIELEGGVLLQVSSSMVAKPSQRVTIDLYGSKATAMYSGYDIPSLKMKGAKINMEQPPVKALHALFASVEGFRQWVMEGRPHLVPASRSLAVLAVIDAIYRSAATGKSECIDNRYLDFK